MIKEVKMMKCERIGSFLRITRQNGFEDTESLLGKKLLGYGLEGYSLASAYAVLLKSGVVFGRNKPKYHGTEKMIDGDTYDPSVEYVLFCERKNRVAARSLFKNYNISVEYIFEVNTNNSSVKVAMSLEGMNIREQVSKTELSQYLICLEDKEFILSSGKISSKYYETIPAANKYDAVQKAIAIYRDELSSTESIVGIGYGGVYLSAYAAMMLEKEFLIYDYNSVCLNTILQRTSVAFVDDFISTGNSILKAYDSMLVQKSIAVVMYAKEKIQKFPIELRIGYFIEQ